MKKRKRMSFEKIVDQNINQILNDKNELERIDKIVEIKHIDRNPHTYEESKKAVGKVSYF